MEQVLFLFPRGGFVPLALEKIKIAQLDQIERPLQPFWPCLSGRLQKSTAKHYIDGYPLLLVPAACLWGPLSLAIMHPSGLAWPTAPPQCNISEVTRVSWVFFLCARAGLRHTVHVTVARRPPPPHSASPKSPPTQSSQVAFFLPTPSRVAFF